MKKLLLVLPIFLLFSCTVQKRKYQNGYYVNWHSKNSAHAKERIANNAVKFSEKSSSAETSIINQDEGIVFASNEEHLTLLEQKNTLSIYSKPPNDSCDVLIFKDGSEIKGKISEVLSNEIKYKRCDNPDGPSYVSRKSELFMIKYANGTREIIQSNEPAKPSERANTYNPKKYENRSTYRQTDPLALAALIFGIIALACGFLIIYTIGAASALFILGLFVISLFAALIAVITGKISLKRIKENRDIYKGKGLAMPGFIFGLVILGIYLTVLLLTLLILSTI